MEISAGAETDSHCHGELLRWLAGEGKVLGFKCQHEVTIIMLLVNSGTVQQNHIFLGAHSSVFPEL